MKSLGDALIAAFRIVDMSALIDSRTCCSFCRLTSKFTRPEEITRQIMALPPANPLQVGCEWLSVQDSTSNTTLIKNARLDLGSFECWFVK